MNRNHSGRPVRKDRIVSDAMCTTFRFVLLAVAVPCFQKNIYAHLRELPLDVVFVVIGSLTRQLRACAFTSPVVPGCGAPPNESLVEREEVVGMSAQGWCEYQVQTHPLLGWRFSLILVLPNLFCRYPTYMSAVLSPNSPIILLKEQNG